MPLINVKLIEGVFSSDQKREIIERLTDAMVSIEGENMRQVTWCVVEEVKSGDWGIARQRASRPSRCTRSPRARSSTCDRLRARPAPGRVPAGPRRGCSLGGMRDELSQALGDDLLDEVVGLTRDLIRVDTTNPPGNETPAVEVLEEYLARNGVDARAGGPRSGARQPDRPGARARHGPDARARRPHRRRLRGSRGLERRRRSRGEVRDGHLWGRGALDMKGQTAASARRARGAGAQRLRSRTATSC